MMRHDDTGVKHAGAIDFASLRHQNRTQHQIWCCVQTTQGCVAIVWRWGLT